MYCSSASTANLSVSWMFIWNKYIVLYMYIIHKHLTAADFTFCIEAVAINFSRCILSVTTIHARLLFTFSNLHNQPVLVIKSERCWSFKRQRVIAKALRALRSPCVDWLCPQIIWYGYYSRVALITFGIVWMKSLFKGSYYSRCPRFHTNSISQWSQFDQQNTMCIFLGS